MDPRVTVQAAFGQDPFAGAEWWNVIPAVKRRGMESFHMALLTKQRGADFQQPGLGGPMGGMAVGAVIPDRGVFPKERPAFFGMTSKAGLVDIGLDEHFRAERSVRIVAVRTGGLAFLDGMARAPEGLRLLLDMAVVADLVLGLLDKNRVLDGMDIMAGRAGYVARMVLTAGPVDPEPAFMAAHANLVLVFYRGR